MPEHENESEFFVFVLMPFDPEFDAVFSKLIVPTLEGNCFSVNRADSALDQENILKNIIRNISKADLVIADMTTMNPNVMYELGIAHAFSKPTVLIAQSIDDVPFDLRSYRVITYSTHFNEAEKFQEKLTEIAKQCMDGSMKFGNPVSDFLENIPSVGNDVDGSYLKIETDEESEGKNSLLTEEEGELGWLDLEVEAEESMGQIVLLMNDISEKSTVLSENIEKHTEQITQLNSEKSGGARQLQQLMLLMSSDMNQYSRE
ncbi:MAG: hypothetical protein HOL05_01370, partial [Nitrospinaceae bacterium]|nr:hypothetical protein [Nitrospinaceae bacterium]